MAAPVRKKNIYKESQMISKLSRNDLEDKHLRLLQDFEQVKKESLAQEDKYKVLFVQLNKLKTSQGKLPAESRAGNPQLQNMVDNLENKLVELEIKNEKLENRLQLSKFHSHLPGKRQPSKLDSKKQTLPKLDKIYSEPAQYTPQHPPRYGHSLLEQARQDNHKLEEYVLCIKNEIHSVESSMKDQDRAHEKSCKSYEERIERLRQELSKSHGLYEIATSRDNMDIIKLQRELLDKTSQLDALKAELMSVQQSLERVRDSHSKIVEELEYNNRKLKEEQRHSADMLVQVRAMTVKNMNIVELQEKLSDVRAENRVLKESNEELMRNVLDGERMRGHQEEVLSLQNKLEKVELAYRQDEMKKSKSLDRLQTEGGEREKMEEELSELQGLYNKLREEHEVVTARLSSVTEGAVINWAELEEAVVYIRSKDTTVTSEELNKELLEAKATLTETALELDKTHKLLDVQHRIRTAERDKLDNMGVRLENVKVEYEQKIDENVHLLDSRAQKIRKLETQLREIAYGTKRYKMRVDEGIDSGEETPGEEVELQRGQNLLEIHLHQLTLYSEVLEKLGDSEPHLFLSYDFFEYETEMTPVTKGSRPVFNFQSNFVIRVDDFFLDYVMRQNVPLEIYLTQGFDYKLVAKGHLDLKPILHDHGGSKIPCTAVATGTGDYHDVIQFGTLEYWLRIRLPVREAFRLYQDRSSALSAIGQKGREKLTVEPELVNELVIKVLSCGDLVSRRDGIVPSPYVMYKFFEYPDHDTDTIPSSNNPKWNDVKKYPVTMDRTLDRYLKTEQLEVYVFDDTDPDLRQYLGLAMVPLLSLVTSSSSEGSFPLLSPSGISVGTLRLKMNWTKSYLPTSSEEVRTGERVPPPPDVQPDSDPERELAGSAVQEDANIASQIEEELLRQTYTLEDAQITNSHISVVSPLLTNTVSSLSDNIDTTSKQLSVDKNTIPSPVPSDQSDVLIDGLIAEMETDHSISPPPESIASMSLPDTPPNEPDVISSELDTLKSSMKVSMTIDSLATFQPTPYFTIVLHSLTAVSDINQELVGKNLIYVDYEFLNYDIEELETPNSIPIPKIGQSILFNFQKMFDFESSPDKETKKKMLQGMLLAGSGSASSAASIKFTIVTDPQESSGGQNCEELGCAYLDLMQVVSTGFNNISADIPVFRLSSPGSIIANITVQLLEINLLREFAGTTSE